jgi:hypothetical protein
MKKIIYVNDIKNNKHRLIVFEGQISYKEVEDYPSLAGALLGILSRWCMLIEVGDMNLAMEKVMKLIQEERFTPTLIQEKEGVF